MLRITAVLAIGLCCLATVPGRADNNPVFPGPTKDGFLLPNGWTVTPVGKQVLITDLPAETFTPEEICVLYRVRWQVELLYKAWKSGGGVGRSRGRRPCAPSTAGRR